MSQKLLLPKIALKPDKSDPTSFDLLLEHKAKSSNKDIHLTAFVYPFNKDISSDDYQIVPFEEYSDDVSKGKKSSYKPVPQFRGELFGLFLGALIALIFALINARELFTVESTVSIIGTYLVGKELWNDLDNFLSNLTANWRVKWYDEDYPLQRENFGTIQKFYDTAREERYQQLTIYPRMLDFTTHSNSKTIDAYYPKADLSNKATGNPRICSIKFNTKKLKYNFMLGIKIRLTTKILFLNINDEYFQASKGKEIGTLDSGGTWKKALLHKRTVNIDRLKIYMTERLIKGTNILA